MHLRIKGLRNYISWALLAFTLVARGQGTVYFNNRDIRNGLDAPVFDADGTRLSGASSFVAQLFAGPSADSLQPVGLSAPFRTGAAAGYWNPGADFQRTIPGVPIGAVATVQVRVWQRSFGETFAEAEAAGSRVAVSKIFTVLTAGPNTLAYLTGLEPFAVGTPANSLPIVTQVPEEITGYLSGSLGITRTFASAPVFSAVWYHNGKLLGSNANRDYWDIPNVTASDAGDYFLVVSNYAGMVTSAVARLSVEVPPVPKLSWLTNQIGIFPGGRGRLDAKVESRVQLTLQWYFNQTNLIANAFDVSLLFRDFNPAQAGEYTIVASNYSGVVTSAVARVVAIDLPLPVITLQPADLTVPAGIMAMLYVVPDQALPVPSFQWRFNGQPIAGATARELTVVSASTNHTGNYDVVLSNATGSVTSRTARLVVTPPPPPVINESPASRYAALGGESIFAVTATGVGPLGYQWFFAGQALSAQTNRTLTLVNVQTSAAGDYFVSVANEGGVVNSQVARLTVLAGSPPRIFRQPAGWQTRAGEDVSLSVDVSGSPPLKFQWRHAGTNLPGATEQQLLIPYIRGFEAGDYSVVVTNGSGAVTSQVARVELAGLLANPSNTDVDGDGHGDLIFQHQDGWVAFWHMDGVRLKSGVILSHPLPPKWRVAGLAQVKRDGHPDLLVETATPRTLGIWNLDGATLLRGVLVPVTRDANLRTVSVRDLDGDGSPDVLQQIFYPDPSPLAGRVSWVRLDGALPVAPLDRLVEAGLSTDWRVAGTGDLNGDGVPEVVLQKKTGALGAWFIANGVFSQGAILTPAQVDAAWTIKAILDLDGDGKDDLVFQHENMSLAVWYMDGTRLKEAAYLEPAYAGVGWELVGPK